MSEPQTLPRVTPFLLRSGDDACPRRLRMELDREGKTQGEFLHDRVRTPFVHDARAAHENGGPPNPASFQPRANLTPEENAVLALARDSYLRLFGTESAQLAPTVDDLAAPWEDAATGLAVSGYFDLPLETPRGPEVRQFELWNAPRGVCADPAESEHMLCLAVRAAAWAADRPLRLVHADVIRGVTVEHVVYPREHARLRSDLGKRLARLVLRAADPEALVGAHCGLCPYIPQCPPHWQ